MKEVLYLLLNNNIYEKKLHITRRNTLVRLSACRKLDIKNIARKQYNAGSFYCAVSCIIHYAAAQRETCMKVAAVILGVRDLNKTLYFVLLCLLSILITYSAKSLLITEDLYFEFFGDQLSFERISEIISTSEKWEWFSYVIIPFYYLIKIFLVGVCIYIGSVVIGVDISFKKIFHVALLAETVFLIPSIYRVFWFFFIQTHYTLSDIQYFFPLSLLNFFDPSSLELWFIYPLQILNVFEVLYWLLLAYGLCLITQTSYFKMLGLIACTYGTGLFIWIILVMFLTVTFSA